MALHPVKWQIESTAPDGYYAFAWGGGLDEPIRTNCHATKQDAIVELRAALQKVGRCPDPSLCNEGTEEGREMLSRLTG